MKKTVEISLMILVPILIAVGCFQDKGKISGRIVDTQGLPVADAAVVTDPEGYEATTNENGEYVISNVPTGRYEVTATKGIYSDTVSAAVKEESFFSCAEINIKADLEFAGGGNGNGSDTRLVAWYKFDESTGTTASDSSSYGNTATITNATWVTGKVNSALSFDGSTAYVEAPHSTSLDLSSEVTLAVWINPSVMGPYNRIVNKSHTADAPPWTMYGLMLGVTGARMEVTVGGVQNVLEGTSVIPTGSWTHVACTYDGTAMNVYVDGVWQSSATIAGTIDSSPTMPLSIGRSGYGADYYNGIIDEVRVYNKALSGSEISVLAQ